MEQVRNLEPVNVQLKPLNTAEPATVDLSTIVPNTALDQLTAKAYLQSNVFPKLEVALNTVSFFLSFSSFLVNYLNFERKKL